MTPHPIIAITQTTHAQHVPVRGQKDGYVYVFRGMPCRLRTRYYRRSDGIWQKVRYLGPDTRIWQLQPPARSPKVTTQVPRAGIVVKSC